MKKYIPYLVASIIIISFASMYVFANHESNNTSDNSPKSSNKKEKIYEHTFAEKIIKSDFFSGEFIRNDIASIYPRRDSLVKDILVDIWDYVEQWQTLAVLFEPWVDGQWWANIWLKSAKLKADQNILVDAKNIYSSKIEEFDAKILEKQNILKETIKNFDTKINQSTNDYNTKIESLKNIIQLEKDILLTLENNLERSKITKENKLNEANSNINQKEILLLETISDVYNKIIPIIYIWEEDEIDFYEISKNDLHYLFSVNNRTNLNNTIDLINDYQQNLDEYDLEKKYSLIKNIVSKTIIWLENTIISVETPKSLLDSYLSISNNLNKTLSNSYEAYEDSINYLEILTSNEEEKIDNLEKKIIEQKSKIKLANDNYSYFSSDSSIDLSKSDKDLIISKLESEINTLKKSKQVLISSENQKITNAKNNILIAQADLNKEYIASGNYKIVSPFSGYISKRNLEIWESASSKMEAFRITWVENSLSKVTKKEIKFYVPESMQSEIELGKEVTFNTTDSSKSFTWTIYRFSPEIDEITKSIIVQAKVDESISLSNKTSLRVGFDSETEIFKLVSSTIYNKDERKIVYYKKDNWKIWVRDVEIVSEDWEFSLITWENIENLKIVTTPIFIK